MTPGDTNARRLWLALAPVLIIFAIAAYLFGRMQNVWVDETTQLSGATLTPGPLIAWLTGKLQMPFGVPGDRMPPVSYFIDMIGWRIWGQNELAFRLYHAAIAAGGIVLLVAAMARRFGTRAALIAGLILALSPKLVETAVEIRAYPIFFALSCAQLAMIVRGDIAGRTGRLILFLLLGLISGYTHFFGVVATSAYIVAVFIDARDVKSAIRVVLGYVLLLILWAGLAPFIFGAATISNASQTAGTGLGDIATFLAQLISNSAILIDMKVTALYFAGFGLLAALAALGLCLIVVRKGLDARHDPALAIALALVAGIVVTLAAAFLAKGFNALSPRYNIWMLPAIALLIALAADGLLAPGGKAMRFLRLGALALFAIGSVLALAGFLKRGEWFIHGPSRTVEAMLAEASAPVAVVHVGTGWAWTYFPLYWRHRETVPQWLLTPDGQSVIRIGRGGDPHGTPQPLSALAGQTTLLVNRVDLMTYKDLRALKGAPDRRDETLAPTLLPAGWTPKQPLYRPGNYAFTGQLYDRRPAPRPTDGKE